MRKLLKKILSLGPNLDNQAKLSLWIIISIAIAILIFLSILGYAGKFGNVVVSFLNNLFGWVVVFLPFAFLWVSVILYRLQRNKKLGDDFNSRLIWGMIFMLASIAGFLNIIFGVEDPGMMDEGGGLFGYIIYPTVLGIFGIGGGVVLLFCLALFGFFLFTQLTFAKFVDTLGETVRDPSKFWDLVPDIFEAWKPIRSSVAQVNLDSLNEVNKTSDRKGSNTPDRDKAESTNTSSGQDTEQKSNQKSRKRKKGSWTLPPFKDILKENHSQSEPGDIIKNQEIIINTLKSFGIEVSMGEVVTGPTVSQYTFKPASGVKLSAIDGLQRDLALSLAASSMRLEAPIPGKSLVGIEIPNKIKSIVRLRDLLQNQKFANYKHPLPVAVGADVAGRRIYASVAKMPHLLVAGATGSGKSVWINSLLVSLLYRYTPEDLQLILVDMKRVELTLYDGIPHLLSPVITDSEKAINSLKWAILEMERRYKLLEKYGKRNIEDFNEFVRTTKLPDFEEQEIPYFVFVIDELGELMLIAKNEVEPIIVRITQLSRAVGIHLVIGTQRPDTQVVTGLIKANVPTRIGFAVASQIDSRVILDQGGAEKLLGQGDGLMTSPANIHPIRFQGCLIEEIEIRRVVNYWKEQVEKGNKETNQNKEILEPPRQKIVVPGMKPSSDNQDVDDYSKAKDYVIQKGGASTSMLQTAFGIGYPKARKIIEKLEQEGVVGPANGSKPREVYISPEQIER